MYHVRVTTSLLADAATVCDGKLYVHGGGWDQLASPSLPFTQSAMAVVLVVEMEQSELETQPHGFAGTLVHDDGEPLGVSVTGRIVAGDLSGHVSGSPVRLPMAISFQGVLFPRAGTYRFQALVDDAVIHSIEFAVRTVP